MLAYGVRYTKGHQFNDRLSSLNPYGTCHTVYCTTGLGHGRSPSANVMSLRNEGERAFANQGCRGFIPCPPEAGSKS